MYIQIDKLRKSYGEGGSYVQVLNGISTQVKKGQMCVILGPSGSGKSGVSPRLITEKYS
ncbi:ATP-binding cassette domain-containing protein [Ruminococcus gauvreauii]|uniref:ATP-binding cassette domain-containing protein n=1 Tax=Ruminococcus gauvreauii TaxID=438033 RepID=UPI0004043D0E|nr:ATP-binding cassette domain-containing protein [Ruminococcus gauvreauii]